MPGGNSLPRRPPEGSLLQLLLRGHAVTIDGNKRTHPEMDKLIIVPEIKSAPYFTGSFQSLLPLSALSWLGTQTHLGHLKLIRFKLKT